MTLPSSPNSISVSQINTEIGSATTTSRTLDFLNGLIKPAQRPVSPNMDSFRGKAYYQRNVDGNCNDGNCGACYTPDCNCDCFDCGIFVCKDCYGYQCINCANCDAQNWLQTNCNCACTYNCNKGQFTSDCQCACG